MGLEGWAARERVKSVAQHCYTVNKSHQAFIVIFQTSPRSRLERAHSCGVPGMACLNRRRVIVSTEESAAKQTDKEGGEKIQKRVEAGFASTGRCLGKQGSSSPHVEHVLATAGSRSQARGSTGGH